MTYSSQQYAIVSFLDCFTPPQQAFLVFKAFSLFFLLGHDWQGYDTSNTPST